MDKFVVDSVLKNYASRAKLVAEELKKLEEDKTVSADEKFDKMIDILKKIDWIEQKGSIK